MCNIFSNAYIIKLKKWRNKNTFLIFKKLHKISKYTKKYSLQEILHLFLIFINYEKAEEKAGKEQTWIAFWKLYQNSLRLLVVPADLNWAAFNCTGFCA